MTRTLLMMAVALVLLPSLALAQPRSGERAPTKPPATALVGSGSLQDFLQRRVVEELAAEGSPLGRLGYEVRVIVSGTSAEVMLIDTANQRVVQVTKVQRLSTDREAALATVTQVVANFVAQQAQAEPSAAPAPGPDGNTSREQAEARYAREAIGFGTWVSLNQQGQVVATSEGSRGWRAWQGELRTSLTATQFYRLVGRSDLETARQSRSRSGSFLIGAGVAGYVATVGTGAYLIYRIDFDEGPPSTIEFMAPALVAIGGLALSSVVLFSGVYKKVTQPIGESEAKQLAQKYNDDLRRKYGLPVSAAPRTVRPDFRLTGIAPYVGEGQGGLVLGGTF